MAQALRAAWAERSEAVQNGLSLDDAAAGFAVVLREMMPPKTSVSCSKCHHGLVGFRTLRHEHPCSCPLGDQWRAMAEDQEASRGWIVKARAREGAI